MMRALKWIHIFMTRSMHLVYFKVEWDFMNNLTLSSGNHVPQDAPVKKKFQSLINLVKNTHCITLFGKLQCTVPHLRAQEVLHGKKEKKFI